MILKWHAYKYFPYEKELAGREVKALLHIHDFSVRDDGVELFGSPSLSAVKNLTYFSSLQRDESSTQTIQHQLEGTARTGKSKQATRYSVHGIHEYKGKFNPQIAKALLNILGVKAGSRVLDPFCGSGTTLVEAAQMGAIGIGTDINPLAAYIANAKLLALVTPIEQLEQILKQIGNLKNVPEKSDLTTPDLRQQYLAAWFDSDILGQIEGLRNKIEFVARDVAPIFLTIASNLLRDYSQQEPSDLRIRRRKAPMPDVPLMRRFTQDSQEFLRKVGLTQELIGRTQATSKAVLGDIAHLDSLDAELAFDAAVTSPPYAMALPYIDTQRLSLVWLDLAASDELMRLEGTLIGSREMSTRAKREMNDVLVSNSDDLPREEASLCIELNAALGEKDGFRRQAVPVLLYRYFVSMRKAFQSIMPAMKAGGKFALIVGHNHTTLGGKRFDIDTPRHLANLAKSCGWTIEELIPLQTYQRFGLHMNNAVASETLIVLQANNQSPDRR